MPIGLRFSLALAIQFLAVTVSGSADAAAGDACAGDTCGLGGQIRNQIGDGLPLPISIAPARTGAFAGITIQTLPATPSGLPINGKGLGQPGQIKATPSATIMQTTMPGSGPRRLTVPSGVFQYGPAPQRSFGAVGFAVVNFAVQTNLIFDSPHPGTTGTVAVGGSSMPAVHPGGSVMFSAGGRAGPATLSYCAGAPGTPGTNFAGACMEPSDGVGINGLVRFSKTANQFGGVSRTRNLGTAKVHFNKDGLALIDLPCTGCEMQISTVVPPLTAVSGATFGETVMIPAFQTPTGVYTGTVGFNGTIRGVGDPVTVDGAGIYFTGQRTTSVGFPWTTGRITISVTDVLPGEPVEIFKRTGVDARDAAGNGVVAMNSGSMSTRSISKGNANRTWITLEIPEPGAAVASAAGLLGLFGCHQLVRQRSSKFRAREGAT